MTNLILNKQLTLLGYEALQLQHRGSPGYSGIRFYLPLLAVGHEPESLALRLRNGSAQVQYRKVTNKTLLSGPVQVYPGRIDLTSTRKEEATFYTYGGELSAEKVAEGVIYTLNSAAPIYELLQPAENDAVRLADETEALFAQAEAHHQISQKQLLESCINAGPLNVYLTVLERILTRYEHDLAGQAGHHASFLTMMRREFEWYRQADPEFSQPSILTDLL